MKQKVASTSVHPVRCCDCIFANLLDSKGKNPLIAECKKKPDSYTGELDRDVAEFMRICKIFKHKK